MAQAVNINAQDVESAANFLEQFLGDAIPEGDFGRGTALRDLTVGALASVFAFLRAEATQVRHLQSLRTVQTATGGDPEATRDAVTAILSNVFISLKGGSRARGAAVGHVSALSDVFIPTTTRFTRASNLVFTVDSSDTYFVSKDELIPIVDADGVVLEYQFRIPLVAGRTGAEFNIEPGLFAGFDRFNPYVTRIENPDRFSGGKGPETVDEVLARAPTALSVRNLVNERSIQAVLHDNFDDLRGIFVAGMGMPEMQRDRVLPQSGLRLHVGGKTDIYLALDLRETSFTGIVGGLFLRPDRLATIFRDATANLAAVRPGDVLRVSAGLPIVPAEFLVLENLGRALVVGDHAPFPLATDEPSPAGTVSYTVGRIGPNYSDVLSGVGGVPLTTGETSRRVQAPGRITLPGGPVMDILDVALLDPPGAESAFRDTLDGLVHFTDRVNGVPSNDVVAPGALQYTTRIHNPLEAQSAFQWLDVQIGTDQNPGRFDGRQLRVRYRTLASFDAIDTFVRSRRQRTSAADQLPRGHHPVVVRADILYKIKSTATTLLADTTIVQTVVDFITAFDTMVSPLDASAIETLLRNSFPTMAHVRLDSLSYVLIAPTGAQLTYRTTDEVRLDSGKQVGGPALDLARYGVTDRTVRYLANATSVTVRRVP
jgi:hypothetical protein